MRCPSCGQNTLALPGQASVCFSCGQPIPASSGGAPGTVRERSEPAIAVPQSFILSGAAGTYKVSVGGEVLIGRDPARCAIHLVEPRVSAHHATLKVEGGSLWVRDERSNNGVWINGERIAAGTWVAVPGGAAVRFGPVTFNVG